MARPSRLTKKPTRFEDYTTIPSTSEEDVAVQEPIEPELYDPIRAVRLSLEMDQDQSLNTGIWGSPEPVAESPGINSGSTISSPLSSASSGTSTITTPVISPTLLEGSCETPLRAPNSTHRQLNVATPHSADVAASYAAYASAAQAAYAAAVHPPYAAAPHPAHAAAPHHIDATARHNYMYMAMQLAPMPNHNLFSLLLDQVQKLNDQLAKGGKQKRAKPKQMNKPAFLPFCSVQDIEAFDASSKEDFDHLVNYLHYYGGKTRKTASVAADLFRASLDIHREFVQSVTITKTLPGKKMLKDTKYCKALITVLKHLQSEFNEMAIPQLLSVLTGGLKAVKNSAAFKKSRK